MVMVLLGLTHCSKTMLNMVMVWHWLKTSKKLES
jgi:hypothetical protein